MGGYAKPSVEQVAQVGVEVEPGTAALADWRPNSFTLSTKPEITFKEARGSGRYFSNKHFVTSQASSGKGEGIPCFRELKRVFDLAFGVATSSEVAPATEEDEGAFAHEYEIKKDRAFWTLEHGDTENATKTRFVYAKGLSLEWNRNADTQALNLELGGGLWTDDEVLTNETTHPITSLDTREITAMSVDVFSDLTSQEYGNTRIDAVSVKFNLGNLANGRQFLNSLKPSISKVVNTVPDASIEIVVEGDAEGRAWVQRALAGERRYFRITASGPEFRSGFSYFLDLRAPVMVKAIDERSDEDGMWVAKYTLGLVEDSDGEIFRASLINDIAPNGTLAEYVDPTP